MYNLIYVLPLPFCLSLKQKLCHPGKTVILFCLHHAPEEVDLFCLWYLFPCSKPIQHISMLVESKWPLCPVLPDSCPVPNMISNCWNFPGRIWDMKPLTCHSHYIKQCIYPVNTTVNLSLQFLFVLWPCFKWQGNLCIAGVKHKLITSVKSNNK